MPRSVRFVQLVRRLQELCGEFLPDERDDLNYSTKDVDQISAFLLLAHAELEYFIEDWTFTLAVEALKGWREDGRASGSLIALLAYHDVKQPDTPPSLTAGTDVILLEERLKAVVTTYCRFVRQINNGIKQKDLLALLLPIGVPDADLDAAWLGGMDVLGQERGERAHKSLSRVQSVMTPTVAAERIDAVVREYERLDARFQQLALN